MKSETSDYEPNLLFEIARGRQTARPGMERRVAVEAVWRSMADGTAHRDHREDWLSYIADRVVSDVIDNKDLDEKGKKGSAALAAICLYGRRVDDSGLLSALDSLMGFENLVCPEEKTSHLETVQSLRQMGYFQDLKDGEAVRKVQNLIQNRLRDTH